MPTIIDLVRNKGLSPKKAASTNGGEYASSCPECGGKDRFRIWPQQNNGEGSFWCRGCNLGGDLIQYMVDIEKMTYPEAFRAAGRTASYEYLPRTPQPAKTAADKWTPAQHLSPSGLWQKKAEKIISWAHKNLLADPKRIKWLSDRGIDKDAAVRFRLGWNPGKNGKDLFRSRESWGLETIKKSNGLNKKLWIPSGLVIPYITDAGIKRIRIRRPEGEPRYYILPGSSMDIMVINSSARAFTIVESELDAILISRAAKHIDLGCIGLGASSVRPDQHTYEILKKALHINIALDSDQAGAKAWFRWWKKHFPHAERWPVPKGKDPGEAYQAGVDLHAWILSGLPPAWSIEHAALGGEKKCEKENIYVDTEKAEPESPDLPASVMELHELLKTNPVMIVVNKTRYFMIEPEGWGLKNWDTGCKISQLVFYDNDCFEFLHDHPGPVVSGDNFLENLKPRH